MTPNQKFYAARLMAVEKMRYLRAGILGLVPLQVSGLDTFGVTENMVLMWDPKAVERWSVEEIAGVFVHEMFHVLRGHSKRCKAIGADPKLWNVAADLEINDDIKHSGMKLPSEGCLPESTHFPKAKGFSEGRLGEEYYRLLEQQKQQGQGQGQPGKGQQGAKGQPGQKGNAPGQGGGEFDPNAPPEEPTHGGWCGSGAGRELPGEPAGGKNPSEAEAAGKAAAASIGQSEAAIERIKRQVAEDIQKEASKGRGTVPGGWARWADSQLAPPKIPWPQKLARVCRMAVAYRPGAVDYRYTSVSRRQAGLGFGPGRPVLPALQSPIPQVAVGVDTSGSMGQKEVGRALAETAGVLKAVGSQVTFLACDAAVHSNKKVRHWKELAALIKGGGGTDFRPVFDAVARMRPRPDVFVFITDGYGPAGDPPPGVKVIWVIVGGNDKAPAPWGEVIVVDDSADMKEAA